MQLFGLAPVGHHAVNLVLHVLNAVLLAVVLFRLTGAWWRSVLVAALFAFHPLRVESVAWISERKDVLSGLFFLLTIEAYRRWVVRPGRARYAVLLVGLALGLMSKSMLVTLPLVLVLLDIWPLGRLQGMTRNPAFSAPALPLAGLIAEKWPLFALSVASAVVTFLVQRQGGAVAGMEMVGLSSRACNALLSYWRYIGMMLWPVGLSPFYPFPRVVDVAGAIAAAAGLVVVTALFLWQARRRPYLLVGWLWYLGMLVPVIGLIQVGGQAYADRYTYLPTIGLVVALAWLAGDLVARSLPGRAVVVVVCSLALVGLSVATVRQVALWKDTHTLFTHARRVTGESLMVYEMLGIANVLEGRTQEGLALLRRGVALVPVDSRARINLAAALLTLPGRDAEAAEHLRLAVRYKPGDAEALNGLAWLLATSPDPAVRRAGEAVQLAGRAVQASGGGDPNLLDTQAPAQAAAGRTTVAVATARRALELAERARDSTLVVAIRGRLASYERGRTWVDSARVAGTSPGQFTRAGDRIVVRVPLAR